MVLIINGNSEVGAHARSNLCNLIYLRHLTKLRAVTNSGSFHRKTYFYLNSRIMLFRKSWWRNPFIMGTKFEKI